MKRSTQLLLFALLLAVVAWLYSTPVRHWPLVGKGDERGSLLPLSDGVGDDPHAQAEMEFLMLRDPRTNRIPDRIRTRELAFARTLKPREVVTSAQGSVLPALVWQERGPNNVGGRTRIFAADVTNSNMLIAGSVAGGIWRSLDDGASWALTTQPAQIHTTTSIAQDTRPGRTPIWYVGTGEMRGSTTNDTRWGSLYRGDGIFKSTNSGATWELLPSTVSGTPNVTDPFDYIWNVATDPAASSQDVVYAATYAGIFRSTDGGGSWSQVLSADSSFTDVAVTAAGVVYAATKNGGVPKVWRSPDGVAWTDLAPSGFPTSAGRVVIAIAPSDPSKVFFFVESANNAPSVNGHQLWRYTYLSGSGSGSDGLWENRGGNLPSGITTQGGYDMIVHVKPDDENFILLGGTNLYRSTNGFTTSTATTQIGGYGFWPGGGHHPDLHNGMFRSGNSSVYYSSHDGGLSKTLDLTASSVTWVSLNNGYNVTQFYSVSLAPDSGSNLIMAGAQDNGTQLGDAPGISSWEMVYGGDGTIVKVAPAADNRLYTQYQNGPIHRQTRSYTDVVSIRPSGSTNQLFVNPILLDPNNSAVLYYAAGRSSPSIGSGIWRNDNAPIATTTAGWTAIAASDVGTASGYTRRVSALGSSVANSSGVLYYGTTDGIVRRMDNATSPSPVVTTITPPGLNGGSSTGGFVRSIAVDPENSNKALLAFGNYNFQSLWYTTDGGTTWTDVEGNLAGPSGPSIRWAIIFYVGNQMHAFLGTSIGVLSTTEFNGASTLWLQEGAVAIGNILIAMLDYRASDRTLAVGTHARGVFTTQFDVPVGVGEKDPAAPVAFVLHQNYPNPFNPSTIIRYELPRDAEISLQIFDVSGALVATLVEGVLAAGVHEAHFDASSVSSGTYMYALRSGESVQVRKLLVIK